MNLKKNKNIIILAIIYITIMIIIACMITCKNSNVIDLSGKLGFDFKIYYEGIDELANYTNLFFEYDGKKTEVFESMKLNEKVLPVVIKEDIDFDGKYELIIYLQEKTNAYYKEKIYFLDYDSGSELSLDQINQKLSKSEELEIINVLESNTFENEDIVLSYIKRKAEVIEVNLDENKAFSLVKDISKEEKNITVEICEDDIIKKINYVNDENLPSDIYNARNDFIKNIIELVKITKNEEGLLINTKGSYLIEYKDVNKDNVEDIIFICDIKENKILNDNVYYLNGSNLEKQNIDIIELSKTPDDYPLNLIHLNPESGSDEPIVLALRNNEIYYLTADLYRSVECTVRDFNNDGENEIVLDPASVDTFMKKRYVHIYKEKDFEEIPFSTNSVFNIIESQFEYNIEYIEDGQVCLATIKNINTSDQIVIKISSDTVKSDFKIDYGEYFTSDIVDNGIIEKTTLCLTNTEYPSKSVPILDFEVTYEMQNDEFVIEGIKYAIKHDFSYIYDFDKYKFEILENSIKDAENSNFIDLSSKLGFDFKIYYEGIDELANYTNLYFEYDGKKTEVFDSMKLSEKGLPVIIKEDIDFNGKYELVIYLQEKTNAYYKEKIYFLDYDSGSELSLDQINQKLSKSEELEIINVLEKNAFENENIVLSYLKRKAEAFEVNLYDNRAFSLVKDISKEDNKITVEIYEDEIIKNINYIDNQNLPSVVSDARQNFIKDIIELVKITKNEKGLLINTQGSYLVEYKDVNKDSIEDIIFICDIEENKILNDNVYYLNGLDLERLNIQIMEMFNSPNDYPLSLILLNPGGIEPEEQRIYLAIRNDEIYYLINDMSPSRDVGCTVRDFNNDGENEIVLDPAPVDTFRKKRYVHIYKEKDFEEIPFSTNSVFDIIESQFEYNIEYIDDGQVCLATIKNINTGDQIVIKISSDTVKPDLKIDYGEYFTSNIVNNGINEIINFCLRNTENSRTVAILDIEVIYEMQNNEFVVKDIKSTLVNDLSVVYGFDGYKFEILENSIIDTTP